MTPPTYSCPELGSWTRWLRGAPFREREGRARPGAGAGSGTEGRLAGSEWVKQGSRSTRGHHRMAEGSSGEAAAGMAPPLPAGERGERERETERERQRERERDRDREIKVGGEGQGAEVSEARRGEKEEK